MKITDTEFAGVKVVTANFAKDERGNFIKIFNEQEFRKEGVCLDVKETYYSMSQKDVIRGMHFQLPPYEHEKLVHVISGSVIDVVLDLRKNSATYKKFMEISLSADTPCALYIPKGIAHGFKSLENNTIMLYQVTTGYQPENDMGIAYDSFGYNWNVQKPIISERDRKFVALSNFSSPF